MKRSNSIQQISDLSLVWDFVIVGGGATGLGAAVDAASRGYKVALLEQADFTKSTSSRSTKLVHGGVRYLAQGDVAMVIEALHERGLMRKNAPHLVKDQRFIIGNYRWWEKPFYTIGLTLYDLLAAKRAFGASLPLSRKRVVAEIPQIATKGLRGGVVYHDGQFDDSRMAVNLAQTATEQGAACANYVQVTGLTKNAEGKIDGVDVCDMLSGKTCHLKTKSVINATGIFVDELMQMDNEQNDRMVRPSQGIHLVVDRSFLGGDTAIMIPKTSDGRVLFGVPWHGKVVLGTTDTPLDEFTLEPRALDEEIEFILRTAGTYLAKQPSRSDVLSVFAGLRPLAAPRKSADAKKTKEISRSHKIMISDSGLLTITGGKWTTYRRMAEDAINKAAAIAGLPRKKCVTKNLHIHGHKKTTDRESFSYVYGSDYEKILQLQNENPAMSKKIHPSYEYTAAEVVWAVRHEMAQTVEDVLARRFRLLFLDARAAIEAAPNVASLMAKELGENHEWEQLQIQIFVEIANGYLIE
ncbi:MAG: glycerol-3-phosphate dehydrogenase/oxidase [Prevotellaceae bacterium]|jgi:glycerol-3-phosphate dehydrogenase|nr:glycerol-3-phosphate dehydrogenase/oxidase [Prevotellaceae bacterium]